MQLAAILRLCHLVSPALPVGAYAYSQALEQAVESGWVKDEASALDWLRGLSSHALATLDLPIVLRLHAAWQRGDASAVQHWNQQLIASRETAELRAEDRHLGSAMVKVLCELDVETARSWRGRDVGLAAMFALAAVHWQIPAAETAGGYLWAWSENQVLAAVKLVPLGQSAGQRLLHQLLEDMPTLVEQAGQLADEQISASAVAQVLGSAMHETQYTRLFRS